MQTSRANCEYGKRQQLSRKLCEHWSHSFPVEFNEEQGTIPYLVAHRRESTVTV
jgi:hypothetical protein